MKIESIWESEEKALDERWTVSINTIEVLRTEDEREKKT